MRSIQFNGATASSLLLLNKEEIDTLIDASRRRIDSIQAVDMLNCLEYENQVLRRIRLSENSTITKFLTGLASICQSKKQDSTDDSGDSYEIYDNLFEDLEKTDLFSGLDTSGSSTMATTFSSFEGSNGEIIDSIIGNSSELYQEDVVDLQEDIIEVNTMFKAIKSRILFMCGSNYNSSEESVLKLLSADNIDFDTSSKAWRDKKRLIDAVNSGRISIYDLSILEIEVLLRVINEEDSLKEIFDLEGNSKSEDDKLAEKVIEALQLNLDQQIGSESKIKYLTRQFLYKADKLGKVEYKLLNIPINALNRAMSYRPFVNKCEWINNSLKNQEYRLSEVRKYLSQVNQIQEIIEKTSHIDIDEVLFEALIILKDSLVEKGVFTEVSIGNEECNLMRDFLKKLNTKGLLQASFSPNEALTEDKLEKELSNDRERNNTLYNEYILYKIKNIFDLQKLGSIDIRLTNYETFLRVNRILVEKYNLIPLTLPEVFEKMLLSTIDDGARVAYTEYKKIIPNIELLRKNLTSIEYRQSVRDYRIKIE